MGKARATRRHNLQRILDKERISYAELSRASMVSASAISNNANFRTEPMISTIYQLVDGINYISKKQYRYSEVFPYVRDKDFDKFGFIAGLQNQSNGKQNYQLVISLSAGIAELAETKIENLKLKRLNDPSTENMIDLLDTIQEYASKISTVTSEFNSQPDNEKNLRELGQKLNEKIIEGLSEWIDEHGRDSVIGFTRSSIFGLIYVLLSKCGVPPLFAGTVSVSSAFGISLESLLPKNSTKE